MDKMTLKQWRRVKEITQEQMADSCGVHVNTYIAWEKEPSKIPISKAILMCERLNITIDDVIFCP